MHYVSLNVITASPGVIRKSWKSSSNLNINSDGVSSGLNLKLDNSFNNIVDVVVPAKTTHQEECNKPQIHSLMGLVAHKLRPMVSLV
jgi:hypothetical protein